MLRQCGIMFKMQVEQSDSLNLNPTLPLTGVLVKEASISPFKTALKVETLRARSGISLMIPFLCLEMPVSLP